MTRSTIPTSAATPIEYIPVLQDRERYKREKTAALRKREQALDRRQQHLNDDAIKDHDHRAEQAAIDTARVAIADEWKYLERNYQTMKELYPSPQVFLVAVPTSVERDQINSRLISLGLTQVTQEQIRATMVEELFHQDWTEPGEDPISPEENEARADGLASFLDSVWLRQEAHDAALSRWKEQEVERVIDEAEGAPPVPRADMPPTIITVREGAKLQLLIDRMMTQSQRLRDLAAANVDFGRRNTVLLMRMHLVGVQGFTPTLPIERDPKTRALPEEVVNALREQIDDASWADLGAFIDEQYKITGAEEKNYASLLGKPSIQDGSVEPSGDLADSGGNSMNSFSEPALVDGSAKTTARSSGSSSGSDTAPASKAPKGSRTADR